MDHVRTAEGILGVHAQVLQAGVGRGGFVDEVVAGLAEQVAVGGGAAVHVGLLLAGVTDALRGELALSLGATIGDLSERMRTALEEAKGRFSPADLLRMIHAAMDLEPHFKRSVQQQLLFETLLVRFALLDRTLSLEEVLKGLPAGGGPALGDRPRPPIERLVERPSRPAPPSRLRDAAPPAPAVEEANDARH